MSTAGECSNPEVPANGLRLQRTEWLLVVLVLVLAGTLVHPYRAQQASRYALTAAIVERGTVVLDEYEGVLGIDRAVKDGHTYSDKAPGQPLLAMPFFALSKAVGVEDATNLRIDGNLGLWWVTFWSAAVAGGGLLVMMYRRAREHSEANAVSASLAVLFGTMLLPFSALLFGHVMAAAFLFGAFRLIANRSSRGRLALAGVAAGMAVVVEYTAVLGVGVLAVFAVARHRRQVWRFVAGGAGPAMILGFYNVVAFGSPFTLSYQFTAFNEVAEAARPILGMFSGATLDNMFRLFFDGRGLLIATPVVVVAVAGALWRLKHGRQPDAALALAMFGVFILLPLFWGNPWGGDSPGPRYMTPALPFLAVPLIWAWQRWRLLTLAAVLISSFTMLTATVTDPLLARDVTGGLGLWVVKLAGGEIVDTLWTMAIGGWGWLVHATAVIGLVVLLRWSTALANENGAASSTDTGADDAAM